MANMNLRNRVEYLCLDTLSEIEPLAGLTRIALSVQVALKEKIARDLHVPRAWRSGLDFGRVDRKVGARDQVLFKKQVVSNRNRSERFQRLVRIEDVILTSCMMGSNNPLGPKPNVSSMGICRRSDGLRSVHNYFSEMDQPWIIGWVVG
jgi:hypothetical protein